MLRMPQPASRGAGRAHRLFHPLAGADLRTLCRILAESGGVPLRRLHVPAIAMASVVMRLPFTLLEALGSRLLLKGEGLPAPVFVVGYWRSGTTHLSNVLSRAEGFGILPPICVGLPQEALGLSRLVRPFIEQFYPKTRLIDDVPLGPELPQEDEIAIANMSAWSFYHGIYFPERSPAWIERGLFFDGAGPHDIERWKRMLRAYVTKMTAHQGGRSLLIRNPVHSARIALLRSIWPDARFIHIHRNPYEVHASAVRMFATLLAELSMQDRSVDTNELVLKTYPRLMAALLRDAGELPAGSFCTVRFEDFERTPMQELQRVFAELRLDGFDAAAPRFAAYLHSVASYRKAPRRLDHRHVAAVTEAWRPFIERWNYEIPESTDAG
jgi:hypothetical protein